MIVEKEFASIFEDNKDISLNEYDINKLIEKTMEINENEFPVISIGNTDKDSPKIQGKVTSKEYENDPEAHEVNINDYIKENCDIAPLPSGPEGTKSITNGLGWAASAQGDNTEGAWKLIEYLGSEEAQTKQAELGVTMSAYEGVSDTWINSHPEFNMQVYLDMMENSQPYPSSKNTQVWFQMEQDKMVDAFSGAKSMEEVCLDIAEEMNGFLAEEQQ